MRPDTYLVRVSRQLVDELVKDEDRPVVLVSIDQQQDGTYDMVFRTPEPPPSLDAMATRVFNRRMHLIPFEDDEMVLSYDAVVSILSAAMDEPATASAPHRPSSETSRKGPS